MKQRQQQPVNVAAKMSVQTRTTSIHQWHFIRLITIQLHALFIVKQKACVYGRACKKRMNMSADVHWSEETARARATANRSERAAKDTVNVSRKCVFVHVIWSCARSYFSRAVNKWCWQFMSRVWFCVYQMFKKLAFLQDKWRTTICVRAYRTYRYDC